MSGDSPLARIFLVMARRDARDDFERTVYASLDRSDERWERFQEAWDEYERDPEAAEAKQRQWVTDNLAPEFYRAEDWEDA